MVTHVVWGPVGGRLPRPENCCMGRRLNGAGCIVCWGWKREERVLWHENCGTVPGGEHSWPQTVSST